MGAATIREADARDLPQLAALLGVRDGLPGPHPGATRALLGLDPARIRVWVAVDDTAIVGMTCAELHALQIGDSVIDAGYWTNLYIREDYRDQLLYPRLPQAMLRDLKKSGITRVYLAIRRLDVAAGHLRIGFREIDRLSVRIKPLRPLSLVSKHFGLPRPLVRVAGVVDRAAGLPLRVAGWHPWSGVGEIVPLSLPSDGPAIAELLRDVRPLSVSRRWDLDTLVARFEPAADGETYHWLGRWHRGSLLGVAAFRVTTREAGLRIGVLMELAARGETFATVTPLLRGAEAALRDRGVDAVLVLDALGPSVADALKYAGYFETNERYVLMVAPKRSIADDDPILDAKAWRFPLSDHDAF